MAADELAAVMVEMAMPVDLEITDWTLVENKAIAEMGRELLAKKKEDDGNVGGGM